MAQYQIYNAVLSPLCISVQFLLKHYTVHGDQRGTATLAP